MYELYVLSELMDGPKTGYHLRKVLQLTLGTHRKISFGVLYPLLKKLSEQGLINLSAEENGTKKTASITQAGAQRLQVLIATPLVHNAHVEEAFLIKLDAIQHAKPAVQLAVLNEYQAWNTEQITSSQASVERLLGLTDMSEVDRQSAMRIIQLKISRNQVTLDWIAQTKQTLNLNGAKS
ncbi:MAG: PadR family transcriptional regulator [Lactobacillaceae bacterium]|jgi:DNA-binding PadR family transcriptional regulator|nr:PadR family transcriptional regulator [Lactobacillaceae bacterium]